MSRQPGPSHPAGGRPELVVNVVVEPSGPRSAHVAALHAALVEQDIQARIITLPDFESLGSLESPGVTAREPSSVLPERTVVPELADVVLVDLSRSDMSDVLRSVRGCPQLAEVPVIVLVDNPDQFGVEEYLDCGVADFISSSASADEVVHRLRVVAARRVQEAAAEEGTEGLRARVRSVSADLADNTDTRDVRVLTRILVRGLAHAFDAERIHVDLFDDELTGILTEQWPTRAAGLPAPGATGSDAAALAHQLWDSGWVGIFNTPSSQNSHDTEDRKDRENSEMDGNSQGTSGGPAGSRSEDPVPTPRCTIAVPLGDTARVSGLVQLISDTGSLPWSEVHTALMQHVAGNFVRALRQVNLHARHTEAIERLAYLNFLKDDFVATINHEFRGPLATITGHLEMAADGLLGPIPDNQRATLDILQRNTARLNNLVENILTVSVLDQPRSQPTPVDLTDIVRTVVTGLQAAAAAKAIVITTDLPTGPLIGTGHRGQLEEALRNVLRNSLDFTDPAGSITLTVTTAPAPDLAGKLTPAQVFDPDDTDESGYVLITVQDTGVGIPADDLPHLYTSFYRGSNIKRSSTTGSGLGLTITKQILDRHEGTITIKSQHGPAPDAGTTVRIQLPLPKP